MSEMAEGPRPSSQAHILHTATRCLVLVIVLFYWYIDVSGPLLRNISNVQIINEKLSGCIWNCADDLGQMWFRRDHVPPSNLLQELERFVKRYPKHVVAKMRYGQRLWELGKEQQALRQWRSISSVDVYFANLAASAASVDDLKRAESLAEISLKIDPAVNAKKGKLYKELCQAYRRGQQYGSALKWCLLLAEARDNSWSRIELATVYYQLGNHEEVIKILIPVVHEGAGEAAAAAAQSMGHSYIATGNWAEAVTSLELAYSMGVSNLWLHIDLAKALLISGDTESACTHYQLAVDFGYVASDAGVAMFRKCK